MDARAAGTWAVSEELRAFTEEMPCERRSILAFVREVDHCQYRTSDWAASVHERSVEVDILAPAAVLREAARVLRPGGGVYPTVPFVWELLAQLAERVAALAPLDVNGILPLGWGASARRP